MEKWKKGAAFSCRILEESKGRLINRWWWRRRSQKGALLYQLQGPLWSYI